MILLVRRRRGGRAPRGAEPAFRVLKGVADADPEPEIRIEASLSLWYVQNYDQARQPLKQFLEHAEPAVRAAAALALKTYEKINQRRY